MFGKLIDRIKKENGKILIVSHIDPDGDAVGSGLALYRFLKNKGKKTEFVLKDPVPAYLDFLPGLDDISNKLNPPYGLSILVDASSFSRTGFEFNGDFGDLVRIDHHKTGETYGPYDILDDDTESCTMLILNLLRNYDDPDEVGIDDKVALYLFTGLSTDTGSFKYLRRKTDVFAFADYLVRKGVDPGHVARMIYQRKTHPSVKVQAYALESLGFWFEERVAYVVITKHDLTRAGAKPDETESLANLILAIRGVEVGVKVLEDSDIWRVSFRGKGLIDLSKVAEKLGGGGHKNASGTRMEGSIEEVLTRIKEALSEAFKRADKEALGKPIGVL